MTHPMKPTPEQLTEWLQQALEVHPGGKPGLIAGYVAHQAYAAGADAELEACCELTHDTGWVNTKRLREERRPAPLTPREQALKALERNSPWMPADDVQTIRQGLEDAGS